MRDEPQETGEIPHLRAVGPGPVVAPLEPPEINLRLFAGLSRWLKEQHGNATHRRVLGCAGLDESDLADSVRWGSLRQLEILMAEVHKLAGSDEAFSEACIYELAAGYGPLRFLLMATTPTMLYAAVTKHFKSVSRVSTYRASFPSRGRTILTYEAPSPDSRIMCLSRQAHAQALPTLWGLPPAHLTERGCMAQGDDACIYELRHFESAPIWLPLAGAAAGTAAAWLAATLVGGPLGVGLGVALGIGGAMAAQLIQLTLRNRANVATGQEINETLRDVINEHSSAKTEVLDLTRRQREWTRILEEQVRARTDRLEGMVDRLRALDQARESNIRGVSHDLRNPLSLLRLGTGLLREKLDMNDPDSRDLVEEHSHAVTQMQELINCMMKEATEDLHRRQHAPEALDVRPAVEIIRRRLRALAHGMDIKTSTFATREVPDQIWCHPIVFDRVVDNLLTNAVKYTERGSIVAELDGTPGFLTIKVCDTGAGIDASRLRAIFQPQGNSQANSSESYGVGLSVVVGLLDEIGGKLEVMSRQGIGTTFWAHFPTEAGSTQHRYDLNSALDRVVTIRRVDEGGS